jgi:nucleoid-associated protein YgaU
MRKNSSKSTAAAPVSQGPGYTTAGNIPTTTNSDVTRILTNQDWATAAQKDLVQKGHDPAQSAAAVDAYVAGQTLTSDQTALIDIALQDIGPLPSTPTGGGSQLSGLHTPQDGNLLGEVAYGVANALGLGNPSNPIAGIADPFLNDVIDQGPVSGVFQAANQVIGGNLSVQAQGLTVQTPAGPITLGGSASNTGLSIGGSTPTGQSVSVGVSPNSSASYIGTYTVQAGDTLDSISQQVYGSTGGASAIYSANLNKIPNPSSLTPGTVLQIPSQSNNG